MIDSIAKTCMVGLLAVATPIDATEPSLWANWGLAGLVVGYVLVRDHQREKRLGAVIDAQQRWIRETLVSALERNAAAMERMVAWLAEEDERDPSRARTRRLRTAGEAHDHHG